MLNRTQKRFFIIYFSFFICLLVMLIPIYLLTARTLEINIMKTSEAVLYGGLQRLEDELRSITIAADTLYSNQEVISLSFINDPVTSLDAYKIRQATRFYVDVTENLQLPSYSGIILKNNVIIASGALYQNGDNFYNGTAFSTSQSNHYSDWLEGLVETNNTYSFSAMTVSTPVAVRDAVVFAVSLPLNTNLNRTLFFSILDDNDLKGMLVLPETLANAVLTIRDTSGVLLLSHDPGGITDYVAIRQTIPNYGLTAELHISKTLFAAGLVEYKNIILMALVIFILLGVFLSVTYSWRNAKPVMRMMSAAANTCEEIGGNLSGISQSSYPNDYQYLSDFISQVDTSLKANKLALLQQENQLKINLFERLIRGEVFTADTFETARKYFPNFPEQYRMVLIKLLFISGLEPLDYAARQIELRSILEPQLPLGSYIHFSGSVIVCVLPCGYLDNRAEYEQLFTRIGEKIIAEANMDVRIAVSALTTDINNLNKTFRQLQQLLRLTDNHCQAVPLLIEDHQIINVLPDQGHQHSASFYEHLVRAQEDMALALLNEDLELLRRSGYVSEADIQQLFYAYRQALAMAFNALDPEDAVGIAIPEYSSQSSVDETFQDIKRCLNQLCTVFKNRQLNSIECFERKVLAMVDENLSNPDLYISMVAKSFGISESTVQRTMHRASGKSFFEYVDDKRMELAKKLLTGTELPVNQIMLQCGYTSLNTFYKAFKRRYGKSPSAMRLA